MLTQGPCPQTCPVSILLPTNYSKIYISTGVDHLIWAYNAHIHRSENDSRSRGRTDHSPQHYDPQGTRSIIFRSRDLNLDWSETGGKKEVIWSGLARGRRDGPGGEEFHALWSGGQPGPNTKSRALTQKSRWNWQTALGSNNPVSPRAISWFCHRKKNTTLILLKTYRYLNAFFCILLNRAKEKSLPEKIIKWPNLHLVTNLATR